MPVSKPKQRHVARKGIIQSRAEERQQTIARIRDDLLSGDTIYDDDILHGFIDVETLRADPRWTMNPKTYVWTKARENAGV